MVKLKPRQIRDFPSYNSTYVSFGDSITAGAGVSAEQYRYPNIIAATKGWTLTNHGVSGMRVCDEPVIDRAYAQVVDANKNYSVMIGVNNAQSNGSNAAFLDTYRGCLMAVCSWLTIPESAKIRAVNLTRTGTWVENTGVYGSMGYRSTTNGSTISGIVTGTSVYVGAIRFSGGGGTYRISVDGQNVGDYTVSGSVNNRVIDGSPYSAYLHRFSGLQYGQHTVTVTVTSTTNASNTVYIDWMAGNGFKKEVTGPNLWLGNATRSTDAYYSTHSPFTDASVALYNAAIDEVFTALASDGLNIALVDTVHSINRTTDMHADGIHPDDDGQAKMAAAFLDQMNSSMRITDRGLAQRRNTPWFDLSYSTGWSAFDAGGIGAWGGVRFMKDALGFVRFRGLAKNTSGANNTSSVNQRIGILPVGFRPKENVRIQAISADLFFEFDVNAAGEITMIGTFTVANNGWVSLNNVTFYADN